MMKLMWIGALALALAGATSTPADAKRLGAGKPAGLQRNMPSRAAPDAAPAKPAVPQQAATPATPTQGPAATPAPKRSWLGPLAGLAAGFGLAALFSHLGWGEGLANLVMLAVLAGGGAFLLLFLLRRLGRAGAPRDAALSAAGAGPLQPAWPQPAPAQRHNLQVETAAIPLSGSATAAPGPAARVFVPASFDSEGLAGIAKMIFMRLQAAHDAADLDELGRFTTPELFASIRTEILERGAAPQHTEVVEVDVQVLDVLKEGARQIVSVRLHGRIVEEQGAEPHPFNEVWHLTRPIDEDQPWVIAGIEPLA